MAAKEKVVRVRRSESQWREVLARLEHSGLTVARFCDREGICSASVYRWRSLLSDLISSPKRMPSEAPRFVDLGVMGDGKASGRFGARVEIRLDLGDGLVVHVVRS